MIRVALHCDPRSVRTATRIFDTLSRKAAALQSKPVIHITVGFTPARPERAVRRVPVLSGMACNP